MSIAATNLAGKVRGVDDAASVAGMLLGGVRSVETDFKRFACRMQCRYLLRITRPTTYDASPSLGCAVCQFATCATLTWMRVRAPACARPGSAQLLMAETCPAAREKMVVTTLRAVKRVSSEHFPVPLVT